MADCEWMWQQARYQQLMNLKVFRWGMDGAHEEVAPAPGQEVAPSLPEVEANNGTVKTGPLYLSCETHQGAGRWAS